MKYNEKYFYLYFFSQVRVQVRRLRPVDGFSRVTAQKT